MIALWSLAHPHAPLSGTKTPFQVAEVHRAHVHSGTHEGPPPVLEARLQPAGPTAPCDVLPLSRSQQTTFLNVKAQPLVDT